MGSEFVVADLHEAGRKDVLKEAADKLECGKAQGLCWLLSSYRHCESARSLE